jgi:hypothetical protein
MRQYPNQLPKEKLSDAKTNQLDKWSSWNFVIRFWRSFENYETQSEGYVSQQVVPRTERTKRVQMNQQPEKVKRKKRRDKKPESQ